MKIAKYMYAHVAMFLVTLTSVAFVMLGSYEYKAVKAIHDDALDVYGDNACTFTATVTSAHSKTVANSSYNTGIGQTRLTTKCADAPSFEIYAVGYSNNSTGNTRLIGQNGGGNINTGTGTGDVSNWSMQISKDTSSYLPAQMTIENSFGSYHAVPGSTTLIATYGTNTDTTTGASVLTTYAARISSSQSPDTYIGKVKYSIVAAEPLPDCLPGYICYDPVNANVVGTMNPGTYTNDTSSNKGYQMATGGSTVALQAPNYFLQGYGFAGWNTKSDGTGTFYGPNQAITVPTNASEGLTLYAIWVASVGYFHNWTGCSNLAPVSYNSSTGTISASLANITALTDYRDMQTYAVARLPDDNCWMIENFRFGGNSATLDGTYTNNPAVPMTYYYPGTSMQTTTYSYTTSAAPAQWCTDGTQSCTERLLFNTDNTVMGKTASTYSTSGNVIAYGNYYNWYGATAGRISHYYTNNAVADGSICPKGWDLPDDTGSEFDTIGYLSKQYGGGYGYIDDVAIVNRLMSFPNNFVYGGYIYGAYIGRGNTGMYSSNTANSTGSGGMWAYEFLMYNGNINDRTITTGTTMTSQGGYTVRCLRPAAKQITDLTYMQDFGTSMTAIDFSGVWNSMREGLQYQLIDNRDNKTYWVSKQTDGMIWMTQNLDLNLSASMTYTHANTDLGWGTDSTTTWRPSASTLSVSYAANGIINSWTDSKSPVSVDPGNVYWDNSKWSNSSYDGLYFMGRSYGSPAQFATTAWTSNGTHGHVGNYYNFAAATATNNSGSYTLDTFSYPDSAPQNSICPAGWRLPKVDGTFDVYENGGSNLGASDLTKLVKYIWNDYGGFTDGSLDLYLVSAPLYINRSGYVTNFGSGYRVEDAGNYGGTYWNAGLVDWGWGGDLAPRSDNINWNNTLTATQTTNGLGDGASIRCLVRQERF
ncbi:hypothetical protein IJ162_01315 [Candidatus Saccharibacteria bacterium]|nr:hypothetical protein [Candidatus Saccharibacteria bacterium]